MDWLIKFFSSEGFMPHGMCLLWRPEIFWLHAVSDTVIALSYYSIPLTLLYFVRHRRDIVFPWVFYMFGAFILACGTTHVMALWTLWHPDYAFDGLIKLATAGLSVATAIVLWPLMPRALALPGPGQLEAINRELKREIGVRQEAEASVLRLNRDLEQRAALRAAELANRELTYRTVIETALDAFILMDQSGRVLEWNPKAEDMFGWPAKEAVGRAVMEMIVPPEHRQAHGEGLQRFLMTGEHRVLRQRIEITALRRDGTEIPVELMIVPFQSEGVWLFSGFIRDLTERKQAEEQLRQAQKMEAVGQLTGGLAHDFNNLLTAMITSLDLLEREVEGNEKAKALTELALRAALRGADLTRHLLAFSRRQTLQAVAFDLNEVAMETAQLLRRTLGENVEIELHLADDLALALADPAQVSSALANLSINARDAMADGGKLTIESANKTLDARYAAENDDVAPGDYVMLAVSDTGSGMSPETLSRVFEPFFTTKSEGKGSGLGLSMVYGFAKQSGGHVKIYSEIGRGTTVRLYLPRAHRSDEAPLQAAHPEREATPLARATILVVEDNADVRQGVLAQLAALGHDVIAAEDAAAALVVLKEERPIDLLFTDVVMPGMSGIDLATEARKLRPGLKVLFTSGFAEAASQNGAAKRNLLSKPYRIGDLARKLRETLGEPDA
jgi:PAS domain S-box-containing protein